MKTVTLTTGRRRWAISTLAALGVTTVLVVSGCSAADSGASASSDGQTTITFSSYNYGTQGAAGSGTQALLDRFAELHPEITVVPEAVPVADVLIKTKAAVVSGNAPDVVQLGYSKMAEGFSTLPVQSIQDIAGDEWDDHVEGIAPGLVETGTIDGTVKALPYTVSIPTIIYNADLFAAAGLSASTPLTTIEDVADAARTIVEHGENGVYFAIVDTAKSDYLTQSVIDSTGGATVDADGEIAVDSPEAIAGIQKIQDLTTAGLQPAVSSDDAVAAFAAGKLGMIVASTAVLGSLQTASAGKFALGSAAFPSFGDGPAKPTHSGAGLIVLSDDEAKQKAAWEFVKFLTSPEGYTMITKGLGYLPLRSDLASDPAYLADYFATNTLLVPPLGQLTDVSPYRSFPGPKSNQATVMLQDDAIAPIVLRDADTGSTLEAVAARIRELTGAS